MYYKHSHFIYFFLSFQNLMVTQYCAEYAVIGHPGSITAYTLVRDAK